MAMSSVSARLSALRRRLFATFMVVATILLFAFGWLILRADQQGQIQQVEAEIDRRATAARSLLYYDENEVLQIDGLIDDEAMEGSPQVYAVALEEGLVFGPAIPDFNLDIDQFVSQSTTQDNTITATTADANGKEIRVVARVFYHDVTGEIAGAVVVTGDPASGTPSGLRPVVFAGIPLVLLLLGAGLWWLITQTIRPAEQTLAQQERFVANAAHELRRPLTAMRANSERAVGEARSELSETTQASFHRNIQLIDRASSMVDNLLLLARLDAYDERADLAPLRLDQLAEAVVDDMVEAGHLQPDSVTVLVGVEVIVAGNEPLLRQAITNLLANAVTHGEVPFEVRVEDGRLVVGDSGDGFDDDVAERAFQRFESGGAGSGSGLGLAIVAAVAESHNAIATVERSPLGGAQVSLNF